MPLQSRTTHHSKVASPGAETSVADALVDLVSRLGVEAAFGVTGGPIASLVHVLEDHSGIRWVMSRTENGAVFEAVGAWCATGRPVLVVATSGPGMLGTRQALEVAKRQGAHLMLVTPRTPADRRGRQVAQGSEAFVSPDFLLPGALFDMVLAIESPGELTPLAAALSAGFSRPSGFLGHVIVPSDLLSQEATATPPIPARRPSSIAVDPSAVDDVAELLRRHRFFIIAGRGARSDAGLVRALAEVTGAPVLTTPGAKGIVDEHDPAAWGVCGIGGDRRAVDRLRAYGADLALVLGSRLSTASVTAALMGVPSLLVHVDRDSFAMAGAWELDTIAVQTDLGPFLEALLARRLVKRPLPSAALHAVEAPSPPPLGAVRPRALMGAIQRAVLDRGRTPVFVDVGAGWPWATSCLRFCQPRRFFLETGVGAMGTGATEAVGYAIAAGTKVLAITGDWSMDMSLPELRTAVDHGARVVWVVLQSFGGQMVIDGDRQIWGRQSSTAHFRPADLAGVARALGAESLTVTSEGEVEGAIATAMASSRPFLIEVLMDTTELAPYGDRFDTLRPGGAGATTGGAGATTGEESQLDQLLERLPFSSSVDIRPVQLVRAMLDLEQVGLAWEQFSRSLFTAGALPARVRELVILRVAWACRNAYVWGGHVRIAESVGLHLVEPGPHSRCWQADELLVLLATDELIRSGRLTPARLARLATILPRRQLLELTLVVGNYRSLAMVAEVAGFHPEPGSSPLPRTWPQPSISSVPARIAS